MKTVIITGGSSGLGIECSRAVAREGGYHVILACRSPARAAPAAEALRALVGDRSTVEVLALDLAWLASVRSFVEAFLDGTRPSLHALVCNAAVQVVRGRQVTSDGFEQTFGVNHLGHFLLTNLLLPHMAPGGRILMVSSGTHDAGRWTGMPTPAFVDAETLAWRISTTEDDATAGRRAYSTSKLCNVFTTYELARRLPAETGVTANAFDPGLMPGSGLARDYAAWQRFVWRFILPVLTLFFRNVNSARRSGEDLAALVTAPKYVPHGETSFEERPR